MPSGPVTTSYPRFTRRSIIGGSIAVAAVLGLPAGRAAAAADLAGVVRAQIDQIRASHGLLPLAVDGHLQAVAAGWTDRMATGVGLAHNPDHRGQYGWPTDSASEVVGYASDSSATADVLALRVVDGWMRSSAHRTILLGSSWTDIGVGCVQAADGRVYATANVVATALPSAAAEALALSQELVGDAAAPRMVVARCDDPADALAASTLLDGQSPLLLVRPGRALPSAVVAEISRAATADTRVYLVGGALPSAIEDQVRATGAQPVRLAGPSRYETAALLAAESGRVRRAPQRIHLVHASQWPDAVAIAGQAALHAMPVLLVDRHGVPRATREVLDANPQADRVVIGGPGVIADGVVSAVRGRRVAGEDRAGTGVAVMRELWGRAAAAAGDHFVVTPGWGADGWAVALAHTTYSAGRTAPLLFSGTSDVPPAVSAAMAAAGYSAGVAGVTRFAHGVPGHQRSSFRTLIGG